MRIKSKTLSKYCLKPELKQKTKIPGKTAPNAKRKETHKGKINITQAKANIC